MSDQSCILSYALKQLVSRLSFWFPRFNTAIYEEGKKTDLIILPLGFSENLACNSMEKLTVRTVSEDGTEAEFLVPAPRRVLLKTGIFPALGKVEDNLDFCGTLIRFLSDEPFLDIHSFNWYGNEKGRVMMEILKNNPEIERIPEALCKFLPYMSVIGMELGINSGRKEIVKRVTKRQMSAVKKQEIKFKE